MRQRQDYSFTVSLSGESFLNKEISGAMIGSSKIKENAEIRKLYGYERGISFYRVEVTPRTLLEQLLEGRVFCHLFQPKKTRKDGSFGSSEKTNDNFRGSYIIGVDIDKTNYNLAREYVATLTQKPTFYYTSYSNKQMGKGARFRLIYVFDELIQEPYYFRYCAKKLNEALERDTGEAITDDCNVRCSQYFNGTCKYNSSIILDYDITNNIYSLGDFGISEKGYKEFLHKGGSYKALTSARKAEFIEILDRLENNATESTITPNREELEPVCSPKLVEDMKRMSYEDFMKYNRHKYSYTYRANTGDWKEGIYQQTEEGYFSLYWNTKKVKDGEKRRKKIFERICLRRVMQPTIDADTLLFNAYEDRYRFFEIDRDLDIDCLVRNVEAALELTIDEIERLYSENLEYLRGRKKAKSFIFKSGEYSSAADIKAARDSIIAEHLNTKLSVKENLEELKKYINIEKSALYNYYKEHGIKLKLTDEELLELIDTTKSSRENEKAIREQGYRVDRNRLLKLLKQAKEEVV